MEPGTSLGDYELVERVGAGGMGNVYRALDAKLGRHVAIKVLADELAANPTFLARFRREAKVLASLNHPNIATIHDFDDRGETPFLVLELLEGETLEASLAGGALAIPTALSVGVQVARALEIAHERDVVHRDLKPSNIMLCGDVVKVLDFGIAKPIGPEAVGATQAATENRDLTATGALIGTAPYMSPEQVRGQQVDKRTDVWAFGCVLFEAITGRGPFTRETVADTLAAILEYEPDWEQLPDACPRTVVALLRRCLQKDKERRTRDLWDSRLQLEEALAELQADEKPATPSRPAPPQDPGPSADRSPEGTPDDAPRLTEGERRQATILVGSIDGYDLLVEQLPAKESERALSHIRAIVTGVAAAHGGVVNRLSGGDMTLLFGVPTAREDDARRAVRTALRLHEEIRSGFRELESRIGDRFTMRTAIHTGPVVFRSATDGDERFHVAGPALELVDRLASEATADEILISDDSHRVVAPYFDTDELSPITLRRSGTHVTPHRVTGESESRDRLEAAAKLGLTRYTGRDRELELLSSCLESAADGAGQLLTIEGDAGVGKSRLLYEFCQRSDSEQIQLVQARCRPDGSGVPFLPFIEALKQIFDVTDGSDSYDPEAVEERILQLDPALEDFVPLYLSLLSIESERHALPAHLKGDDFRMVMLEALSAAFTLPTESNPVVMLLEDWHWADDASHEVLLQLANMLPGFPMLIVVTYRPEARLDWGRGVEREHLKLKPLSAAASLKIIKAVLGVRKFPEQLAELIHERTAGNPFFLEELCRTLQEEGVIRISEQRAVLTGSLDKVHLPDTVQAVILTRLDRLDHGPRELVRLASVIGRELSRRILEETLPDRIPLRSALDELLRLGIIQQTAVVPEPTYRFRHALTLEVAYTSLLPHQVRRLHGQVGEAIETLHSGRLDEHAASLSHHFGAAEEWRKAIDYGYRAARRASELQRADQALALLENVYRWGTELPASAERQQLLVDVLMDMERACETLGRRSRQQELIDELMELLEPHGTSARLAETRIRQGELNTLLGRFEAADGPLQDAIEMSSQLGDKVLERAALRGLGFLRWQQERYDESLECNERALAVSEELQDPQMQVRDLSNLASVLRSAGKPHRAIERMTRALELCEDDENPSNQQYLLNILGKIYRDIGDDDNALKAIERARQMTEKARLHLGQCFHLSTLATIHLEKQNTEKALELYEEMAQVSRNVNYAEGLSIATRRLGELLASLRRDDEALRYLEENAELSAQLHDHESEATSWLKIGRLHERAGRRDAAAEAWQKLRELREQAHDFRGEVEAHEGLARSARGQDHEAAMEHHRTALKMAIGLHDERRQGAILNSMGVTQWQAGNYHDALECYERALKIFEELDDEIHEGVVLNSLAATFRDMGRPEEARTRAEDALKVNRRTGQKVLEGHTIALLGELAMALQENEQALRHFQDSLALRREIGDTRGEGWMLYRLAEVCAAEGLSDLEESYGREATRIAEQNDDAELLQACRDRAAG